MDAYDTGEQLIEEGHSVLLIERGGKRPIQAFKDTPPLTKEAFRRRFRDGMNLAIRLPGLVALDADDEEARERLQGCDESPITQSTPHGEHRVFRLPERLILNCRQRMFGCGYDMKTGTNAFLMFSPSQVNGRQYQLIGEIVPPDELPEFQPEWLPKDRKEQARASSLVSHNRLAVRKWVSHVFSVSGAGGHKQCYRACCRLVDAGLNWSEAWEEVCLWNSTNAEPPWSERELLHKLSDAWKWARKRDPPEGKMGA
jgi:hypothetical protein